MNIIYLIIELFIISGIILLFAIIHSITKYCIRYLNDVPSMKLSQIKSDSNRLVVYMLIKNLKDMKKYIGICLVIIILGLLVGAGIVFNDSRNYFIEYFEAKRQKLNLMHEASVDSLQNVIIMNQKTIDSLAVKINVNQEIVNNLNKQLEKVNQSNANLQYNIRHQNQMIEKLVKENNELKNK